MCDVDVTSNLFASDTLLIGIDAIVTQRVKLLEITHAFLSRSYVDGMVF